MSELTPCCYCTLRSIKRHYGEERVQTRIDERGWTEVLVDGRRVVALQEVTDHCVG